MPPIFCCVLHVEQDKLLKGTAFCQITMPAIMPDFMCRDHLAKPCIHFGIEEHHAMVPAERIHSQKIGKRILIINFNSDLFGNSKRVSCPALPDEDVRLFEN